MRKILAFTIALLFSTVLFASELEGKWKATVDTDNGPFTFYAEFVVKGELLTGTLSSDMGSVEITDGAIKGNEFEYKFELDYNTIKHTGKLVDGKLKIKSGGDYEMEFEMTKVKKE